MTTATTATEPRIYVASLADYNAGRLHGVWIDAAQDADDIHAEVKAMLAEGMPGAEEWAIHDSEGFDGIKLSETESFDTVAGWAAAIEEHGDAFAAWVGYDSKYHTDASDFEDAYRGEWASEAEYAEDWFESTGTFDPGPALAQYIDWTAVWTGELESCGYWSAPADAGRVHVFGS
jgi:antirestriction protein